MIYLQPDHPPPTLRVYPRAFAERIKELFPKLVANGEGTPAIYRDQVQWGSGASAFGRMPWTDWPEAMLIGPLRYARGNSNLKCPDFWKREFPTAFEILAKRDQEAQKGKVSEPFLPP